MSENQNKSVMPPLTRREFLNYVWLAALGFVVTQAACAVSTQPLPIPELDKRTPIDSAWFGSSTIYDVGKVLNKEEPVDQTSGVSQSWVIKNDNKESFVHGQYGAEIPDVVKMLASKIKSPPEC